MFVHSKSINWTNLPLSKKRKEAIASLKAGHGYMAFVLRACGNLEVFSLDSRVKSGISKRTIKEGCFTLLQYNSEVV